MEHDPDAAGTPAVNVDEHVRLVAEMPAVQRLPISERLLLARRRRLDQVTRYERRLRRDAEVERQSTDTAADRRGRRRAVRFVGAVALLDAVRRRDVNEVRALLQCSRRTLSDASVSDGLTALHQACIDGSVDIVTVLLSEFSSDVHCRDDDQWTPLHVAALCGHSIIAQSLIDRGADVLALNSEGNMPYDLCDDESTLDVVESAMAKQGVTQEMINQVRAADEQKMLRDLQRLSRRGHDFEFRGQRGETPLHVAACNGYVVVGEFLLSLHVDVNAVDNDSWTPTHHAALWKQITMLELLVQHGADITAAAFDGRTPSDVCSDAAVREWLLKLKTIQSSISHRRHHHHHHLQPPIARSAVDESKTVGPTSLYSSNLSLADKSTSISSSRRLECVAEKASSRSRRKDASDEAQLWSSIQSLVDDEDLLDSLSRSARDATSARVVPPAQFRRPTPPSIDDQLQLIADDLRNDVLSTPRQQATSTGTASTSGAAAAASATSRRSNSSDDRRRRKGKVGKAKSAKSGRGKDPDGSNWQLKSAAESGPEKQTVKPANNGMVRPSSEHDSTKDSVIPAEHMNGHAVKVSDEENKGGQGQSLAEVKKRRSTHHQNISNGLKANHGDWLTSTSDVPKKSEFVAVNSTVNIKFKNNQIRRCVLM